MYTDGGRGASLACVQLTVDGLQQALTTMNNNRPSFQLTVASTTAEEISNGILRRGDSSLLVMPGGRDLPYVENLSGLGNKEISRFVKSGGSYLGICAGAYYACSAVEFARGDRYLEVCGERELKFFDGTAIGPVFPGFCYSSNAGAKAAKISFTEELPSLMKKDTDASIYYNGGCYMKTATATAYSHRVLAYYTHEPAWPAVVACFFGQGRVVLSGVHLEASARMLAQVYPEDPQFPDLLPSITEDVRQRLLVEVLEYLLTSNASV